MGAALRRTAFSPNIKERRDYSCALFDAAGNVLAMGDHMPVHLGSMPMSVRAAIAELRARARRRRHAQRSLPRRHASARHHRRRSGLRAQSPSTTIARTRARQRHWRLPHDSSSPPAPITPMSAAPTLARWAPVARFTRKDLRIPPVKIVRAGTLDRDILALLLNNVRTPEEREGDLSAQLAACHTGSTRLLELCARYGLPRVQRAARRAARLLREDDARLSGDRACGQLRRRGCARRRWRQRRAGAHCRAHHLSARNKNRAPQAAARRHRLHRQLAAGGRQHQRRRSHHLFRLLLRLPMPAARRRSRHRRTDASDSAHRARGHGRQRASARSRGRRQCRDLAAHR